MKMLSGLAAHCLLLICLTSTASACGSASSDHFSGAERVELADLAPEKLAYLAKATDYAPEDLTSFLGSAFVREVDLNNDGTDEICVSLQTTGTCSNGVAICQILVLRDWEAEPLLDFGGHILVAAPNQDDGWVDLVGVAASSDGEIYQAVYTYTGGQYENDGTVDTLGSWSDKTCVNGPYSELCSPELLSGLIADLP